MELEDVKNKLRKYGFEIIVVMFFLIVFGKTGLIMMGIMACMGVFFIFMFLTKIGNKILLGIVILFIILVIVNLILGNKIHFSLGQTPEY